MSTGAILARIEAQRGVLNQYGYANAPTSESPFNPIIYADVQYSEPITSNRNRVISKYENRHRNMGDIALYDTHVHDLNASERLGPRMHNDAMERARSKVLQRHTDMYLNYDDGDTFADNSGAYVSGMTMSKFDNKQEASLQKVIASGDVDSLIREQMKEGFKKNPGGHFTSGSKSTNGFTYNPYLPLSETNKPPVRKTPTGEVVMPAVVTDERLQWHTNERPWNYESDRANIAFDLQRSQEIIDRNLRQQEADDALLHRARKDRWVEDKMAYRGRSVDPSAVPYKLTNKDKKLASNQNERKTEKSDARKLEEFTRTRAALVSPTHSGYDVHDMNHVNKDVYGTHNPDYAREMHKNFPVNNVATRRVEQTPENAKGIVREAFGFVTDGFKKLLGIRTKDPSGSDPRSRYQGQGDVATQNQQIGDVYVDLPPADGTGGRERFTNKSNHILLVRDGQTIQEFPDEFSDALGSTHVTADELTGLTRTMVMKEGNKFIVLQKHDQDKIFTGDGRRYGEDLIAVELPVASLPVEVREKIRKQNLDNPRSKILDLTYEDFIAFSDYLVKHIDQAERVKLGQLYLRVRTNDYDRDLLTNFEGKRTFMDDRVVNPVPTGNFRMHNPTEHPRIDKQDYGYNAMETYTAPVRKNVRNTQHTQLTGRTGGAQLKQFNS